MLSPCTLPGCTVPIVEAVLAGNGEAAAEAMRLHTEEFGQILIGMEEEFRQRPFPVVV